METVQLAFDRLKDVLLQESTLSPNAASLLVLEFREAHRSLNVQLRESKAQVAQQRQLMDKTELVKQSLLYRKSQLQSQIQLARQEIRPFMKHLFPLQPELWKTLTRQQIIDALVLERDTRKGIVNQIIAQQTKVDVAKSRLILRQKELQRLKDRLAELLKAGQSFTNAHSRLFDIIDNASSANTTPVKSIPVVVEDTSMDIDESSASVELQSQEASIHNEDGETALDENRISERSRILQQAMETLFERLHRIDPQLVSWNTMTDPFSICIGSQESGSTHIILAPLDGALQQHNSTPILVASLRNSDSLATLEEMEEELLALMNSQSDMRLSLTTFHQQIHPGSTGSIPFLWLQMAAGLIPADESHSDLDAICATFLSHIAKTQ